MRTNPREDATRVSALSMSPRGGERRGEIPWRKTAFEHGSKKVAIRQIDKVARLECCGYKMNSALQQPYGMDASTLPL